MMFSLGSSNFLLTFVLLLCGTVVAKKESSNGQQQQENAHQGCISAMLPRVVNMCFFDSV